MTIQDVIERMAVKIESVTGIKGASEYLPEALPTTENWVILYPGETQFIGGEPAGYMTALYSVVIEIHTPRVSLPHAIERLMPFFDAIPNALYDDLFDSYLDGTVSTIGDITSTGLVSLNYAGIDTIAFRYIVNGIKIQTAVS